MGTLLVMNTRVLFPIGKTFRSLTGLGERD